MQGEGARLHPDVPPPPRAHPPSRAPTVTRPLPAQACHRRRTLPAGTPPAMPPDGVDAMEDASVAASPRGTTRIARSTRWPEQGGTTVLVVASAPSYARGVVDRVPAIAP